MADRGAFFNKRYKKGVAFLSKCSVKENGMKTEVEPPRIKRDFPESLADRCGAQFSFQAYGSA